MATVTVAGAGYVGLVTSACLAHLGHDVRCIEIDEGRLGTLKSGQLPIWEPGLDELVDRTTRFGHLSFSGDLPAATREADFIFIAVPTPTTPSGEADVSAVLEVAGAIKPVARAGAVIVVKSTVPVGTGEQVASIAGPGLAVVSNPEFLREGSAVRDFLEPDRVVIGAEDSDVGEAVASLYSGLDAPIIFCDRRSAELGKYAANSYLATRLSFINEVSRICAATGADIGAVTSILGSDPRIGPQYLKPGLGWGGSCLPKDVAALAHTARTAGASDFMLAATLRSNAAQIDFLLDALDSALDGIKGRTVAFMGASFKAGTDDTRDSPAIFAASRVLDGGATVRIHDPVALDGASVREPRLIPVSDLQALPEGADAIVVATDWPEYLNVNWGKFSRIMGGDLVFDARNALQPERIRAAGLRYMSFGRA